MGLLDASSDGGRLASLLSSELFTRGLATVKAELVKSPFLPSNNNNIPSGFTSGLLSASHLRFSLGFCVGLSKASDVGACLWLMDYLEGWPFF
jgi:hypothetical protein